MLIVFGGLPGTGKSTLAKALAQQRQAVYLRIDTIEQALHTSGCSTQDVGPAGYIVAYALAESNLHLGRIVIADSVNPLAITRNAYRRVAIAAACPVLEIEIVCSDLEEHRRRIETRRADSGPTLPTWPDVLANDYEPWDRPHFVLDTAGRGPEESLKELCIWVDRQSG
jgi:predicted kinase